MRVVAAIVGVVVIAIVTFLLGMRTKVPFVLDGVRKMNKRVMNPMQMKSAGTPGAYAGIIHHVGRNSGTEYQTPIGVETLPDGFYVALPYGSRADWVRNVLAAGSATIDDEGATHQVTDPEIVGLDQLGADVSAANRRAFGLFGVDEFLRLRPVDSAN